MGFLGGSKDFATALHYVLVSLSTIAVILRSYARIFIVKKFGLNDKLAICSCFGNIIMTSLVLWLLSYGGGRPTYELTREDYGQILKIAYSIFPIRQFTACCIQLSYLAFYKRFLFDRSQRILYFIAGYSILQNLTFTLLILFRCRPIQEAWNPGNVGGQGCLPMLRLLVALSAGNIILDFSIYIVPMPSVFKLRVPLRRKLGLLALFATGFIVLAASCWHLVTLIQLHLGISGAEAFSSINAATLEFNVAIIIACVPGMKPLFIKAFDIKLSRGGSGTLRRTLNNFVYGDQTAPDPLTSQSPYSGSDIAIRPVPPAHPHDDCIAIDRDGDIGKSDNDCLDRDMDRDPEMGRDIGESAGHFHGVK